MSRLPWEYKKWKIDQLRHVLWQVLQVLPTRWVTLCVCTYSCLRPFKPAHMPIGWSGRSDDNQFTQPRRLRRRRHPTITPKIYSDEQNHIFICCSITFLCLPYLLNTWSVKVWWLNFDQSRKTLELFSCTSMKKVDAGGQCGYPNFCPTFVLCLAFVQHMSSICLNFVLVKHLSNICPKKLTFVLRKSNIRPHSPTYVLFLSFVLAKIHPKIGGHNLVVSWTW